MPDRARARARREFGHPIGSFQAIQIHGGIGFTWEQDIHLFVKRAKSGEALLGSSAWHRERIASLLLG